MITRRGLIEVMERGKLGEKGRVLRKWVGGWVRFVNGFKVYTCIGEMVGC